jgi:hypothetical protein
MSEAAGTSDMPEAVRAVLDQLADQIVTGARRMEPIEVVPRLFVEPVTEPWKPRGYLRDALMWEARMALRAAKPEQIVIADIT